MMTNHGFFKPIKYVGRQFRTLIWPDTCRICQRPLDSSEKYICLHCLTSLPRTNYHRISENRVRQLILPLAPEIHSANWLFYHHDSPWHRLIHDIKYHNTPGLASYLGREFASELVVDRFFDKASVDIILPVPLHWTRLLKRTYNQAERIARGISDVTRIPVGDNLVAVRRHSTQTRRSRESRILNVRDIFDVAEPETLNGRHIALLDDIITTGATISSAARALTDAGVKPASLTLMSLGVTKLQ